VGGGVGGGVRPVVTPIFLLSEWNVLLFRSCRSVFRHIWSLSSAGESSCRGVGNSYLRWTDNAGWRLLLGEGIKDSLSFLQFAKR